MRACVRHAAVIRPLCVCVTCGRCNDGTARGWQGWRGLRGDGDDDCALVVAVHHLVLQLVVAERSPGAMVAAATLQTYRGWPEERAAHRRARLPMLT